MVKLSQHKRDLESEASKKKLEVLQRSDKDDCVSVLVESFMTPHDPIATWICESTGDLSEQALEKRMRKTLKFIMNCICGTCLKHGVVLGSRNEEGKLVGVICCRVPGYPTPTRKESVVKLFKHGLPPPFLHVFSWGFQSIKRFQSLDTMKDTSRDLNRKEEKQHWYIEAFGILPEYRGKGLCAKFLGSVSKVADDHGHSVFLETQSAHNAGLYKRFGFETVEKKNIASAACTKEQNVWFMRRE